MPTVDDPQDRGVDDRSRLLRLLDLADRVSTELSELALSTIEHDAWVAAMERLPHAAARFDAACRRLTHGAHHRVVAPKEGFRTIDQFVRARTGASGRQTRTWMRTAEWLRDFDRFDEANRDGVLTQAHLDKLRLALDTRRTHRLLQRDQQLFVDLAVDGSFADFETACDYWLIAADPDGTLPDEQCRSTDFRARRRRDGMVAIDGLLDPLSGQVFLTAWEGELQKLAVADHEADTTRTTGQRGAAALLQLVSRGAARADGSHAEPLVHIVTSLGVAQAALERYAFGAEVPVDVDSIDIDKRCELIDGTPIHPKLALQALATAALTRVVLDARNLPLEASYASRGFPKEIRHILAIRSRGRCERGGCDAPYAWLQVDHDVPHSKGGPTCYANANLFCRADNLAKGDR